MNNSALGSLGKRAVAWIVILAVGLLILKLAIGAVFGFLTFVFAIALVVAAVMAVMWALRHL